MYWGGSIIAMRKGLPGRFEDILSLQSQSHAFCMSVETFGAGQANDIVGASGEIVFIVFDDAD